MRLKEWILFLFILMVYCQCSSFQDPYQYEEVEEPVRRSTNTFGKPTGNNGECFAKCLIADIFELTTKDYIVFTGDETLEKVDIDYRKIVVQHKRTKWVKKKSPNCRSYNENDCLVWCLVPQPEKIERLKILTDTTQSKNYEIRIIEKEILKEKGGFTEWKEVLCTDDVTPEIITTIQKALIKEDFYKGPLTGTMDQNTKSSLDDFQKFNYLPIGNLDVETLEVLGMEF